MDGHETGWIIELSARLRREIILKDKSTVYDMGGFFSCVAEYDHDLIPYMR